MQLKNDGMLDLRSTMSGTKQVHASSTTHLYGIFPSHLLLEILMLIMLVLFRESYR